MRLPLALAAAALLSGCVEWPFSYAENRCTGAYNQCTNNCTSISATQGGAASACLDRCLASENRCQGVGADSDSLAIGSAIAAKRSQAQKEADYQSWLKKRGEERAAAAATAEKDAATKTDDTKTSDQPQ